MVDEMSIEALFEAEFEDDTQSMEDLFSEALSSVEEAKRRADRLQKAGVSPSTPPYYRIN